MIWRLVGTIQASSGEETQLPLLLWHCTEQQRALEDSNSPQCCLHGVLPSACAFVSSCMACQSEAQPRMTMSATTRGQSSARLCRLQTVHVGQCGHQQPASLQAESSIPAVQTVTSGAVGLLSTQSVDRFESLGQDTPKNHSCTSKRAVMQHGSSPL